ncbi:histidine utilization repressor [Caballeronia catudaia]|uniref:Histidine utilization repressor n=1 Tax=Caballeronia catudaia TaxID=1777136 RepID=A0A158DDM3_9BURK|nr:histidine utilization repressor [Caballeronia catudaia]SAK92376.1 histidine utilization repressor [Caballeronia catudaia]
MSGSPHAKPAERAHQTLGTADSDADADAPLARYVQVKTYIRSKIEAGTWRPGDRVPSELSLVDSLGVSRMTINRALRELTAEGWITRLSGVGTFVAEAKPQSTLLMIAHIGDEIRGRGHEYSSETILVQRESAPAGVANALSLPPSSSVFHLICVHRENGVPVRLEDRYVNPAVAPEFLEQDFTVQRPSEYLAATVPAHEVEHVVDACLPTRSEAELLEMAPDEPCLTLVRRTWSGDAAVTFVRFVHPGSRYRLGCRFKPDHSRYQG